MRRAVLITGHFPRQRRRASMLWISDHLQADGWHVTHVTVGYSWLSALKGDARLQALDHAPASGFQRVSATLDTLYGLSPLHPFRTGTPMVDAALRPLHALFAHYWAPRLRAPLKSADLVICESGAPVMLAPTLARYAPQAARIYRVNDDIRLLNAPDLLIRAEMHHQPHFTRISTASPHLARRFSDHPNVTLDPMGIPRGGLNVSYPDPYPRPSGKIAVCAGTSQLDLGALTQIAQARPNWQLHVLGRLKSPTPALPNLHFHGEQGFDTTLAHIAHADIGLAPYRDAPGVEYQTTNSNRMLLYRHFGLPILGPDRLCHPSAPSIIGTGDLEPALAWAEAASPRPEHIPDWSDLARRLTQNPVTDPPSDTSTVPAVV